MTARPQAGEARQQVARDRRRLLTRGSLIGLGLLGLLSLASAGFFLYAVLALALLMPLAAALSSANLFGIELRRTLSEEMIELGQVARGSLVIENKRKAFAAPWLFCQEHIDPGLDVEGPASAFRRLASGGRMDLSYRLHPLRRGLFRIGPSVLEASGPFGLLRRFRVDSQARFLTVRPRSVPIGQGAALGSMPVHEIPRRRSLFEDPSRFRGIRRYRSGDGLRRVHWRATARSGKLQVKIFEPAVLQGLLLALDLSLDSYPTSRLQARLGKEARDEAPVDDLLELAITAAASLADYVLDGGQQVGLLSNGADAAESFHEDWAGGSFRRLEGATQERERRRKLVAERPIEVPPGRGELQREQLRNALARLMPASGFSLAHLLHAELPQLPRSLVLMVVTPRLDAEMVDTLESLRRSHLEVGVLWLRSPEDVEMDLEGGQSSTLPTALPENIPVYPITREEDLLRFGAHPL